MDEEVEKYKQTLMDEGGDVFLNPKKSTLICCKFLLTDGIN